EVAAQAAEHAVGGGRSILACDGGDERGDGTTVDCRHWARVQAACVLGEMPLDLLERARARLELRLLVGEVAREQRAEGLGRAFRRLPLLRCRIAAESNAGEQIFGLGAGFAEVEHGRVERDALGPIADVVLNNVARAATLAQTHAKAAAVVIPKRFVLDA